MKELDISKDHYTIFLGHETGDTEAPAFILLEDDDAVASLAFGREEAVAMVQWLAEKFDISMYEAIPEQE